MTDEQRSESLYLMRRVEYALSRGFTEDAIKGITNILKRIIGDETSDVEKFTDMTFHTHNHSGMRDPVSWR